MPKGRFKIVTREEITPGCKRVGGKGESTKFVTAAGEVVVVPTPEPPSRSGSNHVRPEYLPDPLDRY